MRASREDRPPWSKRDTAEIGLRVLAIAGEMEIGLRVLAIAGEMEIGPCSFAITDDTEIGSPARLTDGIR